MSTALVLTCSLADAAATPHDEYASVLTRTADRLHGETLFGNCTRCHAADAGGTGDGTVPRIAGQNFRALTRQLVEFRHAQRSTVRMEHFADTPYVAATQDVADVADYISSLKLAGPGLAGDGTELERGASLYARQCTHCHGGQGEGDASKGYPRLAGQHYAYLLRQLYDTAQARLVNLAPEHLHPLEHLDRDDCSAVSDYLSRLTPASLRNTPNSPP